MQEYPITNFAVSNSRVSSLRTQYRTSSSLELLGFWTLSIVRILIVTRKKKNKHDVSETGSVSVLR
jgi:hypothetical protein